MARDLKFIITLQEAIWRPPKPAGIIPKSIAFLSIKTIRQRKRPMRASSIRL